MPRPTNLSRALLDLRVGAKLTQDEAAEKTGFSRSSITNWETGVHVPQVRVVRKLEQVYGVPRGDLIELRRITLQRRVRTNRRRVNRTPYTTTRR
jgi:transcriptional regulator with XRE-family HTH domain